jgi:Fe-S-cluster containining protein
VLSLAHDPNFTKRRIFPDCLSMSGRDIRRLLAKELAAAAAAYQSADIVPHCPSCAKPCCKLESLVLELEWKQVKTFWQLGESRKAFDQRLAAGKGPEEIREGNGLYYIHQKACPSYDLTDGSCKVYGQDIKPAGCSDFPVYEDQGSLLADLRCEAVDLKALTAWIARALGPDVRILQSADEEFPFLVTLAVKRASRKAPAGNRR